MSLTGFSLVGGPAYNDARSAQDILAKLDVPYLAVTPVEFQTLDQWGGSARGLLPVEATMMVAIPELDGATGSMVYGGRGSASHVPARGAHAGASSTASTMFMTCISAPSGPMRLPRASDGWSICADLPAPTARSQPWCLTSRPMQAIPGPRRSYLFSNRCTTRSPR